MIYTVTLNPSIDYTVWTDKLTTGEINRAKQEQLTVGGKGINVSIVLAELGVPSVATGFVAGFTGDEIIKGVEKRGVKAEFICLEKGISRINVKVKCDTETEVNGKGPDISEDELQKLEKKLSSLSDGDILVLAGSVPDNLPSTVYERLVKCMKNVRVVADTTGEHLLSILKYRPFLIKPNIYELEEIVGKKLKNHREVTEAAKQLQSQGAHNVLVSMGGKGALLLDENSTVHIAEPKVGKVINSVGAGDSMVAGFLAGYLEKGDFSYALNLGNAAGAATAFSAGLAEKNEIYRLLK